LVVELKELLDIHFGELVQLHLQPDRHRLCGSFKLAQRLTELTPEELQELLFVDFKHLDFLGPRFKRKPAFTVANYGSSAENVAFFKHIKYDVGLGAFDAVRKDFTSLSNPFIKKQHARAFALINHVEVFVDLVLLNKLVTSRGLLLDK
jgi:hypothetical protein